MNSKERVYAALNHKKTDRVPRFIWFGGQVIKLLTEKLDITPTQLELRYNDILGAWLSINKEMGREVSQGTEFIDEWGITWKRDGSYNMVIRHPLKGESIEAIKNYKCPDAFSSERYKQLYALIEKYGEDHFIVADVSGVLFEPAYHLRDMEDLMVDMALENEEAGILLDKLTEFCIDISKESIKHGADLIWMGDDLGSQKGMLMSPDMWRKYFKPRMKRIIDEIKALKSDIFIAYHSCGSMYPVIKDLVEIGINVLNPIQESAYGMNQEQIKREFGDRITLMCGLDTQQFLVNASANEVREKTKETVKKLGANGGYIFAVSHSIQEDIPLKNILAMLETLESV